jgi:hypothetical protein
MSYTSKLAAALLVAAALASPKPAFAQFGVGGDGGSTSNSGLSIAQAGTVYRFYPNGTTPYNFRAANLNPSDINFQDCQDDIILQFTLTEGGLPTTDTIQVWAGSTDCSQNTARQTGTGPYCWQVAPDGEFGDSQTVTGNIYARNVTRYMDDTTTPHFAPVTGVPGPEACHTQTTSGAVQLSIYFIFINNDGITADAYFNYGQNVDMVGPLAPTLQLPIGIGDGLLLLNWTPQIDSTIQGFNIYAQDQGPNGLGLGAEAGAAVEVTPVYCHSGGVTTCEDAGKTSLDATSDAADSGDLSPADAMCSTTYPDGSALIEVGDASTYASLSTAELAAMGCERGSPVNEISAVQGGATCTSSVLVNVFSTSVTNTTQVDGGSLGEGGTSLSVTADGSAIGGAAGVGISEIDASVYGVGNVGGNTTSSYIITSIPTAGGGSSPLINGHQYAVAVAAYDDDGNVGTLSPLGCQTPEPVIDFWTKYKEDGGLAGGGFCTLPAAGAPVAGSVFGLGIGTALVAISRRRRRRTS